MLQQPEYAWPGTTGELAALVAEHPWATLVSATTGGPVVSHLPVLAEMRSGGLSVLGHLPRADARQHELGHADVVIVVQGPHGYVTADWYVGGPYVPTWNYVVVHAHGRLESLDAESTYDVLDRTVAHFEDARPQPFRLAEVAEYAARIAPAVVGFRLTPQRLEVKAKLSQDKPAADVAAVLDGLDDAGDVHHDAALAGAMRRWAAPA